jgi:hypothetical protein
MGPSVSSPHDVMPGTAYLVLAVLFARDVARSIYYPHMRVRKRKHHTPCASYVPWQGAKGGHGASHQILASMAVGGAVFTSFLGLVPLTRSSMNPGEPHTHTYLCLPVQASSVWPFQMLCIAIVSCRSTRGRT